MPDPEPEPQAPTALSSLDPSSTVSALLAAHKAHPSKKRRRLSLTERLLLNHLRDLGHSKSAIAEMMGRERSTVRVALEEAKLTLEQAAPAFAADWTRASAVAAKKGRHEPAKDALLHVRAIEPVQTSGAIGVTVAVGVAVLAPEGAGQVTAEGQVVSQDELAERGVGGTLTIPGVCLPADNEAK